MSVKIGKIVEFMEEWAPSCQAEGFDNVGLLVGNGSYEAERVLVALDARQDVIDEACERKCQMLITHHPLFRNGIKCVNDGDILGRKIIRLIENKVALFAAHTNLDKADGGVNDVLCRKLGFKNFKTQKDENGANGFLRFIELDRPHGLRELAERCEKALGLKYPPVAVDCGKDINKVAICSGNGISLLGDVISSGADLFITGDIRYHDANNAFEVGLSMLDLTHYASETIIAEAIKAYLEKKRDKGGLQFQVLISEIDAQPFSTFG